MKVGRLIGSLSNSTVTHPNDSFTKDNTCCSYLNSNLEAELVKLKKTIHDMQIICENNAAIIHHLKQKNNRLSSAVSGIQSGLFSLPSSSNNCHLQLTVYFGPSNISNSQLKCTNNTCRIKKDNVHDNITSLNNQIIDCTSAAINYVNDYVKCINSIDNLATIRRVSSLLPLPARIVDLRRARCHPQWISRSRDLRSSSLDSCNLKMRTACAVFHMRFH